MRSVIFAMRDSCAEYFQEPVYARNRAEMIRSLGMAVGDAKSPFSQHAEHFALFELGWFDPITGRIELHLQPVLVINAFELKANLGELKAVSNV